MTDIVGIFYKTIKNNFVLLFVCSGILLFSSCDKDEDIEPVAFLSVVNACPKTSNLEFALDNNRVYLYGFDYNDYVQYIPAITGSRIFSLYKRAESNQLFTTSIQLVEDKHYTFFVTDTISKIEGVLLRDSTRYAGKDSIRIRFANMSPDIPAVDFYFQGNATPIATNISYKTAGNFFSIPDMEDAVIEVRTTGNSTVLATSDKMDLHHQNIYTVWCSGFKGATDNARVAISYMKH